MRVLFLTLIGLLSLYSFGNAQEDYRTLAEIESQLTELKNLAPDHTSLKTLATSPGDKDVWMLKVGRGDEELTPGFLVLAGVDGTHPAGTHTVLGIAEKILTEEGLEGSRLMDRFYFYIVPVLSPDAYAQYHSDLRYERYFNARETDIDRDGRISEDPYNDLDGNGLITKVRIEDPSGTYTGHEKDDRVLVPVKDRKEASVLYRVISEGIDEDKDGEFNEDGEGGINLNMNFSFDYPAFKPGAGEHAVSEEENRALAEFLFERWNIYAVFSYTRENNLSHPVTYDARKASQRLVTGPLERDAAVSGEVADLFQELVNFEDAPEMSQGPGSFSSWAYFHYCRFSFVNPGWIPPMLVDTTDENGANGLDRGLLKNYDLRYINWAENEGIEDYFVDWKEIDHPDFPGRRAEVGGFKPFVRYNPPPEYLVEVIDEQYNFIDSFAKKMPKLQIEDVRVEELENRVFRVRGRVVNTGLLPTSTALGDRTRWVRDIRSRILLDEDQDLLVGHYRDFHKSLAPGEYFEFNWLVSGRGNVVIEAAHPMTFDDSVNLELR